MKLDEWENMKERNIVLMMALLEILERDFWGRSNCIQREFKKWMSSEAYKRNDIVGDPDIILQAVVPMILNCTRYDSSLKKLLYRKLGLPFTGL